MATYNLGRILPVFRGEYQSSVTYNKLDVVYVESRGSFVSQENENTQEPGTGDKWVLLSKDVTNSAAWEAFEQAEAQRENIVNTMVSTAQSDVEDLISESTIKINNTVSGAESEMVQIGQEWDTLKDEMEQYGGDVTDIKTGLANHTSNTDIHVTVADKQRWDAASGGTQVQSDWNESDTESLAFIKNKPTIPSKTSELTNDSNFLTEHQSLKTINNESIVGTGNIEIKGGSDRKTWYGNQAQFNAIPESELDQETDYYISGLISWDDIDHPVIPTSTSQLSNDSDFTSLSQVRNEITIAAKVMKQKQQYVTQSEFDEMKRIGSLKDDTDYFIEGEISIPSKTSDLTNDSGFLTEHQSIKTINNESLIGTGNLTISVPTKTSDLTNDSGFLTSHQSLKTINNQSIVGTGNITIEGGGDAVWGSITGTLSNQSDLNTALNARKQDLDLSTLSQEQMVDFYTNYATYMTTYDLNWEGRPIVSINTYTFPTVGDVRVLEFGIYGQTDAMTGNDTTVGFIVKLVAANGAVQDYSATMTFKRVCHTGSYNDLTDKPSIPSKTSDLTNDSNFLTSHQSLKTINNESIVGTGNLTIEGFSGDYNDLTNKPSIPSKTSDLVNDSNFLTSHQSIKTINNESLIGTGNLTISVPTKTSDLTNDSGFLTSHQTLKTINSESLVGSGNITVSTFSGSYNDLSDKPTIPSNTVAMEVEFSDGTSTTYNVYIR